MRKYNLAIVGATGLVGKTILEVLQQRHFPINDLFLFAGTKSQGTVIKAFDKEYEVETLSEDSIRACNAEIALLAVEGEISSKIAKVFKEIGAIVIDNSSFFRMYKDVPLVVPEINKSTILNNNGIIANPNCSTIQSVIAINPIREIFGIKRIVYCTYQAVSGAGTRGLQALALERFEDSPFTRPIKNNVIPQIDLFDKDGYTLEEKKMINETKKIFDNYSIGVTATAVRVPVDYGHSISINIETEKEFTMSEVNMALNNSPSIILKNSFDNFPTPNDVKGVDEVFVGRVRKDDSTKNGLNIWCVADNIRKGAATNAVQIAEAIINYNTTLEKLF